MGKDQEMVLPNKSFAEKPSGQPMLGFQVLFSPLFRANFFIMKKY